MTLEDAFGNATTKASATTVNLSSNSAGTHEFAATSGGTNVTSVTLPANTASVTAYYGDEKPGTPTITAAAAGLTSGTQPETITAGTGTQLAITSSAFSRSDQQRATNALTVTLEDAYGNATTTASATTINLSSNSAGTHEFAATSGGTNVTSVTLPANTASVTAYYGDEKAGTPTITAAAAGLTSWHPARDHHGGDRDPAGHHLDRVQRRSERLGDQRLHGHPRGHLRQRDHHGQRHHGQPDLDSAGAHEFAATSGGANVTSVTLPANTASVTAYYGDEKPGTPTITAAAAGLTSGTQSETITAAAASKLIFTTGAVSGSASGSATLGPITVRAGRLRQREHDGAHGQLVVELDRRPRVRRHLRWGRRHLRQHPAGSSTATFYYGDTKAGTPTITAAAAG